MRLFFYVLLIGFLFCNAYQRVYANDVDLAIKLNNPVADLISMPFQLNYDHRMGPNDEGHETYLKIQPVIPIHLNSRWNIISRTILPIIDQVDVMPHSRTQFGTGDTLQTFFLSPVSSISSHIIWGLGPAVQVPTGMQTLLGTGKWEIGPSPVVLVQTGPWTYGMLANQLWSFAGNGSRKSVSATYLQPFLAYTTERAWTYTLNSESTYDWKANAWTMPFNFFITKVFHAGNLPLSVGGGVRYWATTPVAGPRDFGVRFVVTLMFPH